MNKLKKTGQLILGFALLAGLTFGAWWVLQALGSAVSGLDKSVLAALITGALVAFGAIWVKHIEHRHSVEAQFRDAKVKLYNEFMETIEKMATQDIAPNELLPLLKEWKRRTLFWGAPKVMRGFLSLGDLGNDTQTVGGMARSIGMMGDLILAMRKDVGLSNRGIVTGSTRGVGKGTIIGARYMLRHTDLFLECLQKDPSMSVDDLSVLEKLADGEKELSSEPPREKSMTQEQTLQPDPTREEKGDQPRPLTEGYQPGRHQGTSRQQAPVRPPTNPPNKGTAGRK